MIKKIQLLFLFSIVACSNDNPVKVFNVQKLRSDLINNIEKPSTENFIKNINLLNDKIEQFSKNINEQNLKILKQEWKKTAISYSTIEPFNIGDVYNSFIYTAFYSWNINETSIEGYIASTTPINKETIDEKPTNSRGLGAIEFLLFKKSPDKTVQSFSNSRRRIDYLKQLGLNLKTKSTHLNSIWNEYRLKFIKNNEVGINGSINLVVNQINMLLENVKGLKIGQPAGIEKNTTANPEKLQAQKSEYSLKLIQENIRSIKNIYFGQDNGLDDYVSSITKNNTLNKKIDAQFSSIENAISKITTPLKTAILNDRNKVKTLYDEIKKLLILIKSDVASTLSITVTFTDNDGD